MVRECSIQPRCITSSSITHYHATTFAFARAAGAIVVVCFIYLFI